jgi:GNAT superfamily N-acetyltransferase
MAFSLRRATADDAQTIFEFITALAEFEREPDAVKTSPSELARQLQRSTPPFECYLAERQGDQGVEAIGFALFFQSYSTWLGKPGLYLEDLFVAPDHRKRGVGRALFQLGAKLALERGHGRYEWAALNWNRQAIDFYLGFGAEPLNEWTTFRLSGAALQRAAGH